MSSRRMVWKIFSTHVTISTWTYWLVLYSHFFGPARTQYDFGRPSRTKGPCLSILAIYDGQFISVYLLCESYFMTLEMDSYLPPSESDPDPSHKTLFHHKLRYFERYNDTNDSILEKYQNEESNRWIRIGLIPINRTSCESITRMNAEKKPTKTNSLKMIYIMVLIMTQMDHTE